ncbi:30S ribosomal protein S18 [Candidatus Berkelbacteria bacterium]|nr:30S ribosomal protein S18 [Candidatus Berkelbacteria bacterium]
MRRRYKKYPKEKLIWVDYKDVLFLRKFLGTWGKVKSAKDNGLSALEQRKVAQAIKRARFLAMLPYAER